MPQAVRQVAPTQEDEFVENREVPAERMEAPVKVKEAQREVQGADSLTTPTKVTLVVDATLLAERLETQAAFLEGRVEALRRAFHLVPDHREAFLAAVSEREDEDLLESAEHLVEGEEAATATPEASVQAQVDLESEVRVLEECAHL